MKASIFGQSVEGEELDLHVRASKHTAATPLFEGLNPYSWLKLSPQWCGYSIARRAPCFVVQFVRVGRGMKHLVLCSARALRQALCPLPVPEGAREGSLCFGSSSSSCAHICRVPRPRNFSSSFEAPCVQLSSPRSLRSSLLCPVSPPPPKSLP